MPLESLAFSALIFAAWLVGLWLAGKLPRRLADIPVEIRAPHVVQAFCHFSIYLYWSLYWDEVSRRAWLIAAQIPFAYLLEMCLTWSRNKVWRFRMGPFPIVFSINLFLWFRDEFYFLQLLLLTLAYLAKEFLTWNQNGRPAHIFNPSAFPLTVTAFLLMATGTVGLTYGLDLTWSFYTAPHFHEVIFLLGLIVQFMFSTTPITFGAALMLFILHRVSGVALGTTIAPHPFDAAVFLGMTFLITDPATSPRSATGRFLFGLLYGLGVFTAYVTLRMIEQPSYFDKIMAVPILNLLSPWCESVATRLHHWGERLHLHAWKRAWAAMLAVWIAYFLAITPVLKDPQVGYEDPLPPPSIDLSPPMADVRIRLLTFRIIHPDVFQPFTFPAEYRNYCRISDFVPGTAEGFVALSRVLMDYERPAEAMAAVQTAIRISPDLAAAHQQLGSIYIRQGNLPAALQELETAVRRDPNLADAHRDLGAALGMIGRQAEAVEEFRRAIALNPRDFTAHYNLGSTFVRGADWDQAVAEFRQAAELKPANGLAQLQLGLALRAQGRPSEANEHFRRAAALMPRNEEARRLIGRASSDAN